MRIRTRLGSSGFLGYCANVHPGEGVQDVLRAISHFAAGVRTELNTPALSLGLWLSQVALAELRAPARLAELTRALAGAQVFVVTLNGFPYGNFHAPVVKRKVYHPDLGTSERRAYLLGLAEVLSQLLPEDCAEGSISTLPLGHRDEPWSSRPAADGGERAAAAAAQLCGLCEDLARLRERTGKSVRICLEPEPGCWLERTSDALEFFSDHLPRAAQRLGTARGLIEQHLGVCFDTCHQAIVFEDARASIDALTRAGIRIGKAQLSSALEIPRPSDPAARAELLAFSEPRFLHQARALAPNGAVSSADDLDQLSALPDDQPWRVHFHVPIHRPSVGLIRTTRPFLEAALPALAALDPLPHLEVETYTWNVLPEAERPRTDHDLMRGLAAEVSFAQKVLS